MPRSGKRKRPCVSLFVVCVIPVPTFLACTFASAIAAPDESVTVPEIAAVAWASRRLTPIMKTRMKALRAQKSLKYRFMLTNPSRLDPSSLVAFAHIAHRPTRAGAKLNYQLLDYTRYAK